MSDVNRVEFVEGEVRWDQNKGFVWILGPEGEEVAMFMYYELESLISGLKEAKETLERGQGFPPVEGLEVTSE